MKRLVLPVLTILAISFSACASTNGLSQGGFYVLPVKKANLVSRCRALADLTADASLDPRSAEIQFRNETAELDGNYVWIVSKVQDGTYLACALQCGAPGVRGYFWGSSATPYSGNTFDGRGYAPLDCNSCTPR